MKTAELVAAFVRAEGEGPRLAMTKYALVTLPRAPKMPSAPTLSDSKSSTPRLPRHTAAAPQVDQTRPDAIAPQMNIAPPAI